jgi:hypothetical protein
MGRATKGVKVMNVADETKIIAMAKAAKEEEEDNADGNGAPEEAQPDNAAEQTEPEQLGLDT